MMVKGIVILVDSMKKTYSGSRRIAHIILNLGTRWRSVVNVTPRPLYPVDEPWYPWKGGWKGPKAGLDNLEKRNLSFPC
jgi:hypothetical protein